MAVCTQVVPQLCQQAKGIGKHLGVTNFKASNGWLEKWKVRHNIKRVAIYGELGEVQSETVESRKERLPEITEWRTYGIWMKLFISGMP